MGSLNSITTALVRPLAGFRFLLRLAAFWLLYFAAFRLWFVLMFRGLWPDDAPSTVAAAFWHALPLDVSMTGYFMALPTLLWVVGLLLPVRLQPGMARVINGFNIALILVLVLVFGSNVFLYEEWHTVLNQRALGYLRTPSALLDSMSVGFQVLSVGLYVAVSWLMIRLYRLIVGRRLFEPGLPRWQAAYFPVNAGLLLLAIRGGTGVMPVNESAVYYSTDIFCNHAATNAAWHLMHSVLETRSTENHYRFLDDGEAARRVEALGLRDTTGTVPGILSLPAGQKPNVVVLLLESMTSQVVAALGGEPGLSPNFDTLLRQGVLFERCYSSGFRTDQGIVSVLGGYPAQPDQSIVLLEDKASKLPSISQVLRRDGYATQFCYGGELTFANIGVWLRHQGFEKVLSEPDFPDPRQRWGADDETVLQRTVEECGKLPRPFLAVTLTLSLHTPYDVPDGVNLTGKRDPDKFRHAAQYADRAIGEFFARARQQPWYANTLFVLVADHGHSLPGDFPQDNPKARHLPLLFAGPAVAPEWRGRRVATIGNHHDVPATLLAALGRADTGADFAWSRNLLRPAGEQFAYYTNEDGVGWVTPRGTGYFRFGDRQWQWFGDSIPANDRENARAYLQMLYTDFLAL